MECGFPFFLADSQLVFRSAVLESVIVVTQCEVGTRNRVCGYLLSDINSRMDISYEQCRDNATAVIDLPWESVARPCNSFIVS